MAAPFPTTSQMNYVPEIFSKKLLARFYESTILAQVTNTDYEGEISGQGSKVIVRQVPEVDIKNYAGTITYDELGEDTVEMTIDRAKSYAFKDDDIFGAQRDIKSFVNEATKNAAEKMKIVIEKDVFGSVYADAGFRFDDGAATPGALSVGKNDVIDLIVDINTKFDEENIPMEGRFLILPAWACGLIKKSDLKDASISGDGQGVIRTGRIGLVDNTTIFSSNCLTTADGGIHALAGTKHAISFASQFVKNEKLRLETTFADAYRGLKVYGFKTLKPDCLIDVLIKKA